MKKSSICLIAVTFCLFNSNPNLFAQKKKTPKNFPGKKVSIYTAPQAVPKVLSGGLTPEMQRRIDSFNMVWFTLRAHYFDQTFNGLDWNKVKAELEPRVLKSTNDSELYEIIQDMISRLNRSHFAVIPPEIYQAIEKTKAETKARAKTNAELNKSDTRVAETAQTESNANEDETLKKYGIGVDLRLIDGKFIVTGVDENSTAQSSGVKTGYIIDKINGVSLTEVLQKIQSYYSKMRNSQKHLQKEIITWLIDGEKDSFVVLTCLDENNQALEIKVQRKELKDEEISIGKNFPEQFLKFETKNLNDETGYIKFNLFAVPVIAKFCSALTEFKEKKAIIIDLRGNSGGIIGSMIGLGGMLTEDSIDLGTSIYKVGSENLKAFSKAKNFKGRLVVLIDSQTVSAAEVFAAALQENNRALVIGEKSAGEALPAVSLKLATGAVLIYPIANFKTHKGNLLEGQGVQPDFVVSLDRKSLLAGQDDQLAKALKIIKENTSFPQTSAQSSINTNQIVVAAAPPLTAKPESRPQGSFVLEAVKPPPNVHSVDKKDSRAVAVINEYLNKIGGTDALGKMNSYTISGTATVAMRGTEAEVKTRVFRQKPDKYSEILNSPTIGEIREVYANEKWFFQSDYGLEKNFPSAVDTEKIEIFSPINFLLKKSNFKSLNYQGVFVVENKKMHLIEGVTADGAVVALSFEAATKLLNTFATQSYTISFEDYRQVENLMLPFKINRGGFSNLFIEEIKINPAIDPANFAKKENCFDKAN